MARVLLLVGFAVIVFTQAAQRGLIEGVVVEWPAYAVGGVAMVMGLLGMRRAEREPVPKDLPESGRTLEEVEEEAAYMEEMRRRAQAARLPDTSGR